MRAALVYAVERARVSGFRLGFEGKRCTFPSGTSVLSVMWVETCGGFMAQIDILDPPHLRAFKRAWIVQTNPEIHVGPFADPEAAGAWASEWFEGTDKEILIIPVILTGDASASMAAAIKFQERPNHL